MPFTLTEVDKLLLIGVLTHRDVDQDLLPTEPLRLPFDPERNVAGRPWTNIR